MWQCRWSPTLGELESTHQEVWGTRDYCDPSQPTVFFGLYGLPDFYALWRHKGEKHVLWAGTDILHLKNNYWLEDGGDITVDNKGICKWIDKHCTNWCENMREQQVLFSLGIEAKVQPSFLGDVTEYEVSYQQSDRPKVYASVSGDNFEQYGWDKIEALASSFSNVEFHLYGNVKPWITKNKNVFVHGRVPKEQMNEECMKMQGALRLMEFDGFSEVLAKSILWGQWPISTISYPYMGKFSELDKLASRREPNYEGREYYLKNLNLYPWNANI